MARYVAMGWVYIIVCSLLLPIFYGIIDELNIIKACSAMIVTALIVLTLKEVRERMGLNEARLDWWTGSIIVLMMMSIIMNYKGLWFIKRVCWKDEDEKWGEDFVMIGMIFGMIIVFLSSWIAVEMTRRDGSEKWRMLRDHYLFNIGYILFISIVSLGWDGIRKGFGVGLEIEVCSIMVIWGIIYYLKERGGIIGIIWSKIGSKYWVNMIMRCIWTMVVSDRAPIDMIIVFSLKITEMERGRDVYKILVYGMIVGIIIIKKILIVYGWV